MSQPNPFESEGEIIDVGSRRPRLRRWLWLLVIAIAVLVLLASRGLSIFLSALWFGSLGYAPVYWYMFRLKIELFLIFLLLTVAIVRGGLWLIELAFSPFAFGPRTIFINQQPVNVSPGRLLRPLAWIVSGLAGLIFGFGMRESWRRFALYFHQSQTDLTDPVFHKPVAFYLFTLPVYDAISEWLLYLSIIILCAAVIYALLTVTQPGLAIGLAIPLAVYIVATILIPAYVTSFIVRPNELNREAPYIEQNIAWTRRAFGVDRIEQRSFDAETTAESFDLQNNRPTLDNIRLWDWRALKDTLTQIQAIRTYYDFTDVDVDRYVIGGQKRQMMVGTREINVERLPESSRNWVNE